MRRGANEFRNRHHFATLTDNGTPIFNIGQCPIHYLWHYENKHSIFRELQPPGVALPVPFHIQRYGNRLHTTAWKRSGVTQPGKGW